MNQNAKQIKKWVDKVSEFCNRSMKSFLQSNDIEIYSMYNERKSLIAKRFIRTLKDKIYKYMTSISKNVYIDKLDDIVNTYNNTCHSKFKIKHVDIKSSTYNDTRKEIYDNDAPFNTIYIVRISKYKHIFWISCVPNSSEEVLVILKDKNTMPWTFVNSDLKWEEIIGTFYEKELQKPNQKELKVEKVIRKGNKLYLKRNGYNSWIDKKDII